MRYLNKGVIGLCLVMLGIVLFLLIVPTVGDAEKGLKDYC